MVPLVKHLPLMQTWARGPPFDPLGPLPAVAWPETGALPCAPFGGVGVVVTVTSVPMP